ncbi:hypothetical protein [Streptomyces roseolilacinus]|uniref:hypothetical protein n=1 Tax=Streptomyces roseolilacinus TaxID=66904 RepID=UPI0038257B41
MSTEIVRLVEQAGPCLTTAVSAYGVAVFSRTESAAVDATANLGRRILQAVWHRRDERGRVELEAAVRDAAEAPEDADAAAALRQQVKRALREDAGLPAELARMLPAAGETVNVTASGERSVAAKTIGTAVTGDNVTIKP